MSKQESINGRATKLANSADRAVTQQIDDLKSALLDLIEHPAIADAPDLDELRARIQAQVIETSHALQEAKDSARETISSKADEIDEFVHEEPWKVAGVAAALGLVIGVLISKR